MKRSILFFLFGIFLIGLPLQKVQAQVDPRGKMVGMMALYGTVGGTLLGTASLAFGTEGRSVAKGASIGLYAGLLFGAFVVTSHHMKQQALENPEAQENYYPDAETPYGEEGEGGEGEGDGSAEDYRWRKNWHEQSFKWIHLAPKSISPSLIKQGPDIPLFYFNLIEMRF
jgi:hypothetical protein